MSPTQEFDVVVIGAGPTGENVADRVVRGGLSAVIVESELVGGECSYWACMPSKALLRPAHVLEDARRVGGAREAVTGALDVAAVLSRRDQFASNWDDAGQVKWLTDAGIELVRGGGRISGVRRVTVEGGSTRTELAARRAVVVATGSASAFPPVAGLEAARPWTTREATSVKARDVPKRLVVLGGGVAGCELAQVFASLGTSVTICEVANRLLPSHEPFAGELLAGRMAEMGVEVRTAVRVEGVRREGASVRVELESEQLSCDELLVAAGRRPNTSDIGLETIGLTPGSWLAVDDSMLVTGVEGEWLYAAGDVNHRALLTHQGKYQARVCGDSIVARARGSFDGQPWSKCAATADHSAVPSVVFTDPEVASVGETAEQARGRGLAVRVVDHDVGSVAGAALSADGYVGLARLVVDEERNVLVGATFVGAGVAELLHAATIAVVGEVTLDRLWHAVPSYPTISEVWLRLLEDLGF